MCDTRRMGRMAESLAALRSNYDAIVIGTGYGGGVAACRLARAGLQVAILERGRELRPGDFPESAAQAAPEMQLQRRGKRRIGRPTALFDCRVSDDVVALVGCGVGGTSLINASVSLEAKPEIFDDPLWPEPLRGSSIDPQLAAGYESARAMLRPQLYPESPPDSLPKLDVLRRAGAVAGTETTRVPINVTFTDRTNSTGIEQPACTGCGDCVTGCNVGAKNTTDLTYIADAVAHGGHLVVEAAVDHVSRVGDIWRVHVLPAGAAGPQVTVEAPIVVLAAGALGSTEILERSRRAGLWVSDSLGQSVSGNGDFLGYGYDGDDLVHGIGRGAEVDIDDPVGPCITGGFVVDAPMENGDTTPVLFEEGTMPRALGRLMRVPLWVLSLKNPLEAERDRERRFRRFRSIFQDPYHGPLSRTLVFLGMGFDSDAGTLDVPADPRRNSVIDWPGVGSSQEQVATDVAAHALGESIDASYLRSPVFGKMVTVHPLGGAAMAESGAAGVVNHEGEVFAGTGDQVHDGLFVADGAIVPTPLGANPSFTIAALAERSMARLVDRLGRPAPTADAPRAPTVKPGITFRERMTGTCRSNGGDDGVIDLRLAIAHRDLERFEADYSTPAQVRGTAEIGLPGLGLMAIEAGEMIAFVPDPDVVGQADMIYDLRTTGADGRRYRIAGIKRLHDHPGFDLWRDTTRLDVTVFSVTDGVEIELATGTASLGLGELMRMAASARATGSGAGIMHRTGVAARFVWRFQQGLRGTYGKVMRQSSRYSGVARSR